MRIDTHQAYVSYWHDLRFVASASPHAPWTRVASAPRPEVKAERWGALAEWLRTVEARGEVHAFRLGRLARLADESIGDTRPTTAILSALLNVADRDDGDDRLYAHELVALALRCGRGSEYEPVLRRFLTSAASEERSRVPWWLDLAAAATKTEWLSWIDEALPGRVTSLDRAELRLHSVRLEADPEIARQLALALKDEVAAAPLSIDAKTAAGSDAHRRALLRLRLSIEMSYRASELDEWREAAEVSQAAFNEAATYGLPSMEANPSHDLAGFDVLAQVAAADWVRSALAANANIAELHQPVGSRGLDGASFEALRRVRRGRFFTDYDNCAELIDSAGAAALTRQFDAALEELGRAADIADDLRCFSLESTVSERLARVELRQMELESAASEREVYASDAMQHAGRAGATELIETACRGLGSELSVGADAIVHAMGTRLRVERVARLVAMRELMTFATDSELVAWCAATTEDCRTGLASMDSRFDVKRGAIRTSARLLGECVGLPQREDFESIVRRIVSTWGELVTGEPPVSGLVVHEISEAAHDFVRLPLSEVPVDVVEQLFSLAETLPKDPRTITGNAWVNFVRPAIEVVLGAGSVDRDRVETLRSRALSWLPSWAALRRPPEASRPGVPPFPPSQTELLAMSYRCLLGDVSQGDVHAAVASMTSYCEHFADGRHRVGLRFPMRPDLALSIATHGESDDEAKLLAIVLRMALCAELDTGARAEAIEACHSWLRRSTKPEVDRMKMLEAAHPHVADHLIAALRARDTSVPRQGLGLAGDGEVVGALLVTCAEVVRLRAVAGLPAAASELGEVALLVQVLGADRRIHVRGSAANINATLLLTNQLSAVPRDRIAVAFLSHTCDAEERVVDAALGGLRWALEVGPVGVLGDDLLQLVASHIAERARTGSRAVARQARLALRALHAAAPEAPGVNAALTRVGFSEADERIWRRHQLVRRGRLSGRS